MHQIAPMSIAVQSAKYNVNAVRLFMPPNVRGHRRASVMTDQGAMLHARPGGPRGSASRTSQPRLPTATCVPERENLQRFLRHAIVEIAANSAECEPTDASCFRARRRNAETRLG